MSKETLEKALRKNERLEKEIQHKLIIEHNVLTELEEWLKDVDFFQMNFVKNKNHITPCKLVLEKIQKLKEKYK
jgi:hypothetical protein